MDANILEKFEMLISSWHFIIFMLVVIDMFR